MILWLQVLLFLPDEFGVNLQTCPVEVNVLQRPYEV